MRRAERIEVRVGQLWKDCDKRMGGRTLRVKSILGMYAYCDVGVCGRSTRIRLDRFRPNSTGFQLIRDENGKRVDQPELYA